jgi:hypothetical protein
VDVDTADLLRDFMTWADRKGREPDLALLDDLLRLRSAYDELEPTYWPDGSVEHLLIERWPSKGSVETPEAAVVVETLDSYLRFLRTTGRMSGRSADVAPLTKEARKAARRMRAVADDRANWSINKVLADFGRSRGVDLDTAPDVETLQARLEEINAQWNALPMDERHRLMPRPGRGPDPDLSERDQAMELFGVDDPLIAQVLTYQGRLPTGDLPGSDVVGPLVRQSAYVRKVIDLAHWVGEGKELTAIGVLRPAVARQAYADLGLGPWQRELVERRYPDERLPGVAAMGRDAWIEREMEQTWRSAADCDELHRLWCGAVACGLVKLDGRRASLAGELPESDDDWTEVGVRAVAGLADLLREQAFSTAILTHALLESYVTGCGPVNKKGTLDFIAVWVLSASERAEWAGDGWRGEFFGPDVEAAAWLMGDTGVYREEGDTLTLTLFGDVFVTAWLGYLESEDAD